MHIAIVRKAYSLKKAGAERYCVNLTRHLQALGQQVTIIGETIDPELRDEVEFVPVKVTHTTSWAKNRSFADNAARAVAQRRFDVVHGLSRTPAVDCFRVTDPLQAHWFQVYYRNPWARWIQRFNPRHRMLFSLEQSIYQAPWVRRIITQSRLDSQLVSEYYGVPPDKIRRVYNGVDTRVFHPGVRADAAAVREELRLEPDTPLLVFASMDFRRKGLGPVLQALALSQHREARLVVVGNGQCDLYAALAAKLGIGGRVLFAGRRTDIQRFYGAGDLFVLPTLYEPFPNVNLEAMACGLPVLTSATAGGADIINEGQNGYCVTDGQSVAELTERIDRHLALPAVDRARMAACCWETAREMTLEKNARQTLAVLEEAALEKSRV